MGFDDFDEYIKQGEPTQKEKAENWSIAIGLQAVDGLKPSKYSGLLSFVLIIKT